ISTPAFVGTSHPSGRHTGCGGIRGERNPQARYRNGGGMITTTVIRTTDEFARLHDEWNTLLAASAADCAFLTHEWLFTWWKHLADGRELTIVTARDGGNLIGILPLARRTAQYARMM